MRATVVDMTVDDSDHEVSGPLRGNKFALLNDRRSEDLNEQVGPDLGGVGCRRRLVLRYRRHGEDASTSHQQDPDLDGADSVEGASEAEVEDVVEPTAVSPSLDMEPLVRAPGGAFASLDGVCLTDVIENRARVMRSVPFVMRGAFRAALRVASEEIVQGVEVQSEIRAVRAWKLLLLLPRTLLFRPTRGGLVSRKQLEARVRRFQARHLDFAVGRKFRVC